MTTFAIGMLSGYGTEHVARRLDDHVKRISRPTEEPTVKRVSPTPSPKDKAPDAEDSLPVTRITSGAAK